MVVIIFIFINPKLLYSQCSSFIQVGDQASPVITDLTGVPGYTPNQGTYCLEVHGNFFISENYKFVNCEFKMMPGSTFFINPTFPSNLVEINDNCKFYGVDEMWNGIVVSTPFGPPGNITQLEFKFHNSSIRDAVYAIKIESNLILNVVNSEFINNYIGIYSSKIGSPRNVLVRDFAGNTFKTIMGSGGIGTMLHPYDSNQPYTYNQKSYAGVYLDNVWNFTVGENPSGAFGLNIFQDLHNGVYCNRTNLEVKGSKFINIFDQSPYVSTGTQVPGAIVAYNNYGLYSLKVKGLGKEVPCIVNSMNGILFKDQLNVEINDCNVDAKILGVSGSSDIIPSTNYKISNNKIIGSYNACSLFDIYNTTGNREISNNTILLNQYNGPKPPSGTSDWGIRLENSFQSPSTGVNIQNNIIAINRNIDPNDLTCGICIKDLSNIQVNENNITAGSGANANLNWQGIVSSNCSNGNITVNQITGSGIEDGKLATGIVINSSPGMNIACNALTQTQEGMLFLGDCSMDRIALNEFNVHKTGLHYLNGTSTAPVQNDVRNKWLSTSTNFCALNEEMNQFLVGLSAYKVHTLSMPYMPIPRFPTNGWFTSLVNPSSIQYCSGNGVTGGGGDDELTQNYFNNVIQSNFPAMTYQEGRQFWAQWNLYRTHNQNQGLFGLYQSVGTWVSAQSNSTLGRLSTIYDKMPHLGVGSLTQSEINTLTTHLSALLSSQTVTIELMQTATGAQLTALQNQLSSIQDSLGLLDSIAQQFLVIFSADKETHRLNAIQQLQTIFPVLLPESNLKNAIQIYLNKIAVGSSLTNSEIQILQNIASQCYLEGGPGVLLARNLLKRAGIAGVYNDDQVCSFIPQPIVASTYDRRDASALTLFPNPASSGLKIILKDEMIKELEIADLKGLVKMKVMPVSSETDVDISALEPGMYIIKVRSKNSDVLYRKLIKE